MGNFFVTTFQYISFSEEYFVSWELLWLFSIKFINFVYLLIFQEVCCKRYKSCDRISRRSWWYWMITDLLLAIKNHADNFWLFLKNKYNIYIFMYTSLCVYTVYAPTLSEVRFRFALVCQSVYSKNLWQRWKSVGMCVHISSLP